MNEGRTGWIATALVVGTLVLGLVWLSSSGRDVRLGRSPTGFDGLVYWLRAEGIAVRNFGGGYPLDGSVVALRILPLFDADPGERRDPPRTREDVLLLDTERDLRWDVIDQKLGATPTLVVLPKWRRGARLTGVAHPALLIPDESLEASVTHLLDMSVAPLARGNAQLSTATAAGFATRDLVLGPDRYAATLYAPRTARATGCGVILGTPEAALLLACVQNRGADGLVRYFVLTDPDLINNHGLALGENAALAAAVLSELAPGLGEDGRSIVVDYSSEFWTRDGPPPEPEPRDWDDLVALFLWPYSLIWGALAGVFALALWHSNVRYGPAAAPPGPALLAPTDAEARLLRLSGDHGRLLSDYADRRMTALTHRLLGPRTGITTLIALLPRRAPKAGPHLLKAAERLHTQPAALASDTALAEMRAFEALIDQVIDEFD